MGRWWASLQSWGALKEGRAQRVSHQLQREGLNREPRAPPARSPGHVVICRAVPTTFLEPGKTLRRLLMVCQVHVCEQGGRSNPQGAVRSGRRGTLAPCCTTGHSEEAFA